MARIGWNSIITACVALVVAVSGDNPALAQWSTSISQGEISRPWEQHLVVLQSLPDLISAVEESQARARLSENLAILEADIGEYGLAIQTFIYRLAEDPQFVYIAAATSQELSTRLARVHVEFHSLYSGLQVHEREDVIAAQASLDALRKIMEEKIKFENDVTNALGAGSRRQIMDVANRWWIGKEKSEEVQKYAANLRQQLGGEAGGGESK